MATIADYISAISTDSAKLATDQGNVTLAQAALDAANATVAADTTTVTADDTALSQALQAANVWAFVSNPDGSVSIYAYSAQAPGFTITTAQPAGGLTVNQPAPVNPSA
jgi:hypothetical protein